MDNQRLRRRRVVFAVLCLVALVVAVAYPMVSRARRANASGSAATGATPSDNGAAIDAARGPHLLFRSTRLDATYGRLGVVPLDRLDGPRFATSLRCERVHFASGTGLCLTADRGLKTFYRAELFDDRFRVTEHLALNGVPSRARVAPDGKLAALTFFVSGDSYQATGFSTRSVLLDSANGRTVGELEEFTVTRDGAPFQSVDFNFWGVTFARLSGLFYATLGTRGHNYLVEGDASKKTARVIIDNVECPSLSPDNLRVAFKRREPGIRITWRIHVLDLASSTDVALAETRSVDDQVEWLDDREIVYALPAEGGRMDVWTMNADGTGTPRLVLTEASSPAVVRPASAVASR